MDKFDFGTRYRQSNQLFEQIEPVRFQEVTAGAGPGFAIEAVTRGSAVGDLDHDGDLDILFGNLDGPPTLLRNDTLAGSWALIRLVGPLQNAPAVGAVVTVTAKDHTQVLAVGHSSGFLSTSDSRLHVGLGAAERIELITVRWPDGREEVFTNLPARRLITLTEGDPTAVVSELP